MRVYYSLYDRLLSSQSLKAAFRKVKSAKGAAGIDGQSVYDFAKQEDVNVAQLVHELKTKTYCPHPNRQVSIPKDNGGERLLGIPCVRDRVVQQALLNILQPIFEPQFHPSSYAYRPGRGCHQAIAKTTKFIREHELVWVVDMDLSRCFDTLDHDLILKAFRKRIADGSILNLIRLFLKSGVMLDEGWRESEIGSPQGGVISPLISNVAENALEQAKAILENDLRLTVNREKTRLLHAREGIPYLGVIVRRTTTAIQPKRLARFKEKVKAITRRNSPVNVARVIKDLNPVVRGFANYFRVANCKSVFTSLMQWMRRRLRAKQLKLWKKPSRLHRRLRQLGYKGDFKAISMTRWRNSASPLANYAIPNAEIMKLGLYDMLSADIGVLPQVA